MYKILIAEDDTDSREILKQQLRHLGYEVIEASNGLEALEQAQKERPDLVILDIMMPQADGREVARRLRQDLKIDTPIIASTVFFQREDIQTCLDAGCNDILVKPFSLQELKEKLEQFLRGKGSPP